MGAYWQSGKDATTDSSTPHQDDIDVALLDALHAFSNETSKAGTHPSPSTDEAYEGSSTRNNGRPLNSTHARQSVDPDVPSPQIVTGFDAENFCPEQRCKGHGYLNIVDFRNIPQFNSKEKRPPYRYATLIAMAILRANNHCLSLAQIYQWISDNSPYYSMTESGWQNSIRHNLSLNKNFIKTKRPSHDPGKSHFWGIEPGHRCLFTHERTRHHSVTTMDDLQSTCDSDRHSYTRNEGLDFSDKTIEKPPPTKNRTLLHDCRDQRAQWRGRQSACPSLAISSDTIGTPPITTRGTDLAAAVGGRDGLYRKDIESGGRWRHQQLQLRAV
jgi:hypothetical protein